MSIKAKPWEGGTGGATVPDASETTKGKIQIATSAEATTGTNDLKAMTPLTVKERIDAALVGGVEYKGSYTGQSLVTADKGDLYVSAATYSLAGVQVLSGDHIIFNQDAADPVTSAMFDKIDNTDQVASVNGLTGAVTISADDLAADHSASNYTAANTNIDGHLSGIDTALGARQPLDAQLTDVAGLTPTSNHVIIGDNSNFTAAQLASTQLSDSADLARLASPAFTGSPTAPTQSASDNSTKIATTAYVDSAVTSAGGNQITDIEIKTGSTFTAEANHLYVCGYTSGTQTITFPDASNSTTGDIIGLSTQSTTRSVSLVSSDGTTNDLLNNDNDTRGGTNGALNLSIHRQVSWFVSDGAQWLETNAALKPVATTGAYSDLSGTPTVPSALNGLSDVTITSAASGNLLQHNGSGQFVNVAKSTINVGTFNDDNTYQPKDAQLTDIAGLTPADGKFIVGDGSNFVTESGATARASLGLVIGTDVAAIASPALTGSPTAPTQSAGDDSTKIATTAYVDSAVTAGGGATDLNGLSDVTITSAASGNLLQHNGSGQFVNVAKSTINVGTFNDDNTYQPKDAQLTDIAGLTPADGKFIVGDGSNFVTESGATARASLGLVIGTDVAAIASPALTGSPTAPTQSAGDDSTKIATTAYVDSAVTAGGGATDLNGLSDVTITSAASGNLLQHNGSGQFVNVAKSTINVGTFNDDNTYQPKDAQLTDIAGLTPADGKFIVGDGSNFVTESGATARTSLGLVIGTDVQAFDAQLTDVAGLTPADGKFIVGDGSNFVTESGATARASLGLVIGTDVLGDVVSDTSPQLGGNLDTNGQDIVTTSNADLDLAPDGTGVVVIRGNQTGGNNQGAIKLNCEQNSHGVTIKAPAHSATATYTLTLPTSDGSADQVLKTDGSGVLSWVDQSGGSGGGWTYSAITADPANAQVSYHYSCTGTFTATLPAVSGTSAGDEIRFKNMGTGDITIDGNGSETVDGSLTYVMSIQYESITCVSTGSAWEIV